MSYSTDAVPSTSNVNTNIHYDTVSDTVTSLSEIIESLHLNLHFTPLQELKTMRYLHRYAKYLLNRKPAYLVFDDKLYLKDLVNSA